MSSALTFSDVAWEDYLFWQENDRQILRKINKLIKECQRAPETGSGHPEPLRFEYTGWWSRHINQEHRLVFRMKDGVLEINQCRFHYGPK